jgi:hypothetical protein
MAKKKQIDLKDVNFDELNLSEIRSLCERPGRPVSPRSSRLEMIDYLLRGTELADNPIDDVRTHQMQVIVDNLTLYRASLPMPLPDGSQCSGNCYDHCDIQVVECQVQTAAFRHNTYKETL